MLETVDEARRYGPYLACQFLLGVFFMLMRRGLLAALLAVLVFIPSVQAERPIAPKLLPDRTVGLLRIRNYPETRTKFGETATGKMLADEEVGPLLSGLYEQLQELYSQVEDRVGVPLEKLRSLPQGEIWLAAVPPANEGPMGLALLIDAGNQVATANKLLERGEALLVERGGKKIEETLADTKVNIFVPPGVDEPRRETKKDAATGKEWTELVVGLGTTVEFERDGAVVIASTPALAEEILNSWNGSEKTLSENERFAAIMRRCQSSEDAPEFEWYVDPINLIKGLAQGNPGAQIGLALIPALGLDGLQGVGGTLTFNSGEFDQVGHTHILLENPKSGVMEVLQMASGDATPEPWVPSDVLGYMTINWDLQASWEKGSKVYDSYFSEGRAAQQVGNFVKNRLDIDFEKELLPALAGRITVAQWAEPPARLNSGSNMVALKLTDAKAFQPILERIMAKYPERLEKQSFSGTTYYTINLPQGPNQPDEETIRRPSPCLALVGDYLILSDSVKFFEHCVKTQSTGKTLANEVDYKLVASKIARQAGGAKPGFVQFSRPEEGMKLLYDLATSENTRQNLARQAENNEFFKRLNDTLEKNPLPPFKVLAKYLAPAGAMMTQDETGFHYMSFGLKRK
jgi:hypothetical protein